MSRFWKAPCPCTVENFCQSEVGEERGVTVGAMGKPISAQANCACGWKGGHIEEMRTHSIRSFSEEELGRSEKVCAPLSR